ncbi:MAG: patatin-like phospholipase family protein [Acidimicrobiales bacterium]
MTRVGLVLGAGGTTGGAFHAGVLAALESELGWDARTADVILGTSAGSVTGATLRAGLGAADLAARAEGTPVSAEAERLLLAAGVPVGAPPTPEGPPPRPDRSAPAAPQVLLAAARRPWAVRPVSLIAGLLPRGTVPTTMISSGVRSLLGDRWPGRPLWVAAVRLDAGELVVFGRDGSPPAGPGEAVAASCAIPGWFRPVTIGGSRYVDGGAHSLTNVAQMAGAGVDLVVVSAPMGRAGRYGGGALRQVARAQLALEARALWLRGVPVVAFQPTEEDQAAMGSNPMDPARRAATCRQVRRSTAARLRLPETRRRLIERLVAET